MSHLTDLTTWTHANSNQHPYSSSGHTAKTMRHSPKWLPPIPPGSLVHLFSGTVLRVNPFVRSMLQWIRHKHQTLCYCTIYAIGHYTRNWVPRPTPSIYPTNVYGSPSTRKAISRHHQLGFIPCAPERLQATNEGPFHDFWGFLKVVFSDRIKRSLPWRNVSSNPTFLLENFPPQNGIFLGFFLTPPNSLIALNTSNSL